jgi:diguanylate cyclase (GGDEF)-like protein
VRETDVVSRLGGDEFAVLLLETDVPGSAEILERIRAQFDDEPATTSAGPVPITLTFGVAGLAPGDADGDALVARADAALYVAKEGGRNRVATPDGLVDRTSTAGATVAE